jgi:hypothetical protein
MDHADDDFLFPQRIKGTHIACRDGDARLDQDRAAVRS